MKTMECRTGGCTEPDRINTLFTKPYQLVSKIALLHAIGYAEDEKGTDPALWTILQRIRDQYQKKIFSVRGGGGACWIPDDAPDEFVVENYRPMPAFVTLMPDDQRLACEAVWPHVRSVVMNTKVQDKVMIEGIHPILPEGLYQTLVRMTSFIASDEHHSVGIHDLFPEGHRDFESYALWVSISRLNTFFESREIPFRLKPSQVRHYAFKNILKST